MISKQYFSNFFVAVFMAVSVLLVLAPVEANAQAMAIAAASNDASSEPTTPNNIAELVSDLNAEEIDVLNKLLKILTTDEVATQLSPDGEKAGFLENLQSIWQSYSTFMWTNALALPAAIKIGYQAVVQPVAGRGLLGGVQYLLLVGLALIAGVILEFIAGKILNRKKSNSSSKSEETVQPTSNSPAKEMLVDLAKLVLFAIGALIAIRLLFSNPDDRFPASAFVLYVVLVVRIMMTFLGFVLSPNNASIRPVSTNDWNARYIYRNFLFLAGFIAVAFYLLMVIKRFEIGDSAPFGFWLGQIILVGLLYVTWRARHGISDIIRGDEEVLTPGLERMAAWWPIISMAVITIQFVIMNLIKSTGGIKITASALITTIMLIVFAPFFDTMLRYVINRFIPKLQGEGEIAEAAFFETKYSYMRISRVVFVAVLLFAIGKIWGVNFRNLAQMGFGGEIAQKGSGFLLISAVGYLAWEVTNLWVNRQLVKDTPLTEVASEEGGGEGGGAGKSRLATVLPLVRMTVQTAIVLLTVLLGLGQLGVNITPLLAGAGVFGLAIGFGAQALVKDVVSGVFFLLDDAFRVGEFIEIEGIMGTVEKISIRSLQLRHPNGPIHVIPYGEIPKLTNNSRDYVILKLRFTVPFDTDLEKVRKLFKKIGQQMMENPEHAENFIQPFKFQGVVDVDDVGIIIRGKFSTKPGAQWMIRKEIYARVQQSFEDNGIHFARREVLVQIPGLDDNKNLNPNQVQAVATAAAQAVSIAANTKDAAPKKEEPF